MSLLGRIFSRAHLYTVSFDDYDPENPVHREIVNYQAKGAKGKFWQVAEKKWGMFHVKRAPDSIDATTNGPYVWLGAMSEIDARRLAQKSGLHVMKTSDQEISSFVRAFDAFTNA